MIQIFLAGGRAIQPEVVQEVLVDLKILSEMEAALPYAVLALFTQSTLFAFLTLLTLFTLLKLLYTA